MYLDVTFEELYEAGAQHVFIVQTAVSRTQMLVDVGDEADWLRHSGDSHPHP